MNFVYLVDSFTAQGPRASNQDATRADADLGYALVADGMGGAAGGEVASATTVAAVHATLAAHPAQTRSGLPPARLCKQAARHANQQVSRIAEERPELRGMGSTLALVCISGGEFCAANVGDSRVYLWRDRTLTRLSHDHSRVQERIDAGIITEEQARTQPDRNVITRVIGVPDDVAPHLASGSVQPGDVFLLTSDGVHGVLRDPQLEAVLTLASRPPAAETVVRAALSQSTQDNATAALLWVDAEDPAAADGASKHGSANRLARLFRRTVG